MFGPYFTFPIAPLNPPKVGTQWKKPSETLWWSVLEAEAEKVVLEGPGHCKGKLSLTLEEFYRSFRRV